MTLWDFREWFVQHPSITMLNIKSVTCGRINQQDNVVGLYGRRGDNGGVAVGGIETTSYADKHMALLIHGSQNYVDSEELAQAVYDMLEKYTYTNADINGYDSFLTLKQDSPIFVGSDDRGIFEFTVDLKITYNRK